MLTIIYGSFGSGKSTELYSRISKCLEQKDKYKKSIYLIVPEQDTVRAEMKTASLFPASCTLAFETLNFSRLANSAFRMLGGLSYNYADKASKALCMWQSIESLGGLLNSKIDGVDEGKIQKTLAIANELRASGVSLAELEAASRRLGDSSLGRELGDLSLILTVYEASLSEKYSDSEKDIDKLASLLEANKLFGDADFYIDGFSSFTVPELRVIKRLLADSRGVTVTLPLDFACGEYMYSDEILKTKSQLQTLAESVGQSVEYIRTEGKNSEQSEALRYLSKNFYLDGAPAFDGEHSSVEVYGTSDIKEEAEAVAALIKKKVLSGARYRDIAVIARDTHLYEGVFQRAFDRHAIPCFFAREKKAEAHPAVRLIYYALSIFANGGRREDIIGFIKTGYTDISADECNIFEKYVNSWKINSKRIFDRENFKNSPGGYTDRRDSRYESVLETSNRVKRALGEIFCPFLTEFSEKREISEFASLLWSFLERIKLREKLQTQAEQYERYGDEQSARECEGVYSCIVSSIDALVNILGTQSASAGDFYKLFRLTLRTKKVSVIPTSADAVTVGDALMLRADSVSHTIIVGASDGVFPQAVKDKTYFDYAKRKQLSDIGINIECDMELDASKELFYFARAACSAKKSLSVLYSSDGKRISSSAVRLMRILNIEGPVEYSSLPVEERVFDRAGAYEAALSADFENNKEDAGLAALSLVSKEWEKGTYELQRVLSPETARQMFGKKLSMTQSRLESYARCHFAFFCRYILALDENRQYDFSASDIGNFVHNILDELTDRLCQGKEQFFDMSDGDIEKEASEIIESYILRVCPEGDGRSARLMSLFLRLRRSVGVICKNICHEFCQSRFTPVAHEMKILDNSPINPSPLTFTLSEGAELSLYGTLDRADACVMGDDVYVRVIDYKTGAKDFSLRDVERGLNLQLMIYLFCMCSETKASFIEYIGGNENSKIRPAGMLYYSASVADLKINSPRSKEELDRAAEQQLLRKGLLTKNESVLRGMEPSLEGKYIPISQGKDGIKAGTGITFFDEGEFEALREQVGEVVVGMAEELCRGNFEAKPHEYAGSRLCEMCSMRVICRNYGEYGTNGENAIKTAAEEGDYVS